MTIPGSGQGEERGWTGKEPEPLCEEEGSCLPLLSVFLSHCIVTFLLEAQLTPYQSILSKNIIKSHALGKAYISIFI